MTTLPEHIAALRAALEAGPTPGPHSIHRSSCTAVVGPTGRVVATTGGAQSNLPQDKDLPERQAADARLIAAAHPEAIRALLDALDEARRDAERYRFIRDADRSDCITPELGLYAMDSLDEYVDAAMEDEIRNAALATGA